MSKPNVRNYKYEEIKRIAKAHNITTILHGTGDPVNEPCLIYWEDDALTTGRSGINILIYPKGEEYRDEAIYKFI